MFKQYCKVVSDEIDGDSRGEWNIHYVLYEAEDDNGAPCYELYDDDGKGNGTMICRGYNVHRMRSLTLRLGRFVEWQAAA